MRKLIALIVLVWTLTAILAVTALAGGHKPSPYSICGYCDGGGGPPFPCDQWHAGENWYYNGHIYYCDANGVWWLVQ